MSPQVPPSPLIFTITETNYPDEVLLKIRGTDRSWQFPKDVAEQIIIWNDTHAALVEALKEAQDDLHGEFCGTECHSVCLRAKAVLLAAGEAV